jgi:GNAT superfamily N-acetyltransferase
MRTFIITTGLFVGLSLVSGGWAAGQTMQSAGAPQSMSTMPGAAFGSGNGLYVLPNGGTIAGSYWSGMAAYMQALGQYNYNTSLALREAQEARRAWLENNLEAEQKYFEMRRINQENWLAQHPRLTSEQVANIEQSRLPKRLTASELDPTWGVIQWPAVLRRPEFEQYRVSLQDLFAHRREQNSGIGTETYNEVQQLTRQMREVLNREVPTNEHQVMTQMEWIHAARFLESLAYEARFAPGDTVAARG